MKGFNIQQMMKQAQQMQQRMQAAQEELQNMEITGEAASQAVIVTANGKNEIKSIKIKPEAINAEDPASVDEETIEILEDLILSAIQDANKKVSAANEEKMSYVSGGMPMNIPGFF